MNHSAISFWLQMILNALAAFQVGLFTHSVVGGMMAFSTLIALTSAIREGK